MSDDRLTQALAFANYRQTLNNQIQKLKIRTDGQLIIAKNGGSFTVNRELMCFLDYLVRTDITEAALIDDNKVPVLIEDIPAFLKEVTQRYFSVTTDYLKEFQELRKSRNVKSILSIKEE